MNILYLKIKKHGIGNIVCNIIILLVWMIKSNEYDKLILINSKKRKDLFNNYCIEIKNDKFEIIELDDFKNNINNIITLKSYFKKYFSSKISTIFNKSNLTDINFHWLKASNEDLLIAKKFFYLKPNKLVDNEIKILKKNWEIILVFI